MPLGVIAAYNRGKLADHVIRITSVAGHAVPTFWFGLLFVTILGVQLRWFPIGSMNVVGVDCVFCWDRLWHIVGPVITLSLTGIAAYPRYLRTEVLEIIRQDYVRTAQSKGLRDRSIAVGHVLRNSLIPVVTRLGGRCDRNFADCLVECCGESSSWRASLREPSRTFPVWVFLSST